MRHRVGTVRGIEEKHAGFAVVMRLLDNLVEQITSADCFINFDRYTCCAGLFKRAREAVIFGRGDVGENQVPVFVFFDGVPLRMIYDNRKQSLTLYLWARNVSSTAGF